ncbi:hypothetical protein NADFUDRAFT_81248 [Nadsonia fulvescens var. elongata DSM 6958]|uniref:C2H2-type domain-containing protein n=1 Tax=Nadsonia fulvescens var. elongata DSM 6958 TaxID=857566 RepID=A0A1E3PS17_9ASCO|nr:hypothetical protein NADFUDRAFT_81248 [Nadsonia fulvescens var. elongata DSM 6958]
MFSCGKCPLSFRRNHDLKRHSRSHLPVRPYDCEVCMKSFSRKDALKRHRAANACKRFLRDMGSSQRETGDVDKLEVIQSNNDPIMPNTAKVEQSYDDKNNKNN